MTSDMSRGTVNTLRILNCGVVGGGLCRVVFAAGPRILSAFRRFRGSFGTSNLQALMP